MSLWVAVDDSLQSDELLAGAGAAALAALAADGQPPGRHPARDQGRWLARAFRCPARSPRHVDRLRRAREDAGHAAPATPAASGNCPSATGTTRPLGVTRRVLLTGACSLAPNKFVLGMDEERDVMVVHELVTDR